MAYDFDTVVNRWNTTSAKWDGMKGRFGTSDAIPMWVADMDFQSPPEVIAALVNRARHGIYGYSVRPDSFFDSVVAWMKERHGYPIEREWIAHSSGVVSGLGHIVKALTDPGDKVIIQPPVYYPFRRLLDVQGRQIVENPLRFEDGAYTMNYDDLERKAADGAKMLIFCSPHNPVGRVWTREELTKMGEICMRHNVFVVSDEIHGDLIYRGYQHVPFGSISEEFNQHSITAIAPSKTFNLAGLQTSVLIIRDEGMRKKVNETMANNFTGMANAFGITALEAAYQHGGPWVDALMDYLADNLQYITDFLEEHVPSIRVVQPQGTYLVWLDCADLGLEGKELDEFMLHKAKLALDEGYIFGEAGARFQRINIACPRSVLVQAMQQLGAAVQRLKQERHTQVN